MTTSFLPTNDFNAFRDYQTRSTILVERERAVEARRLAVHELRQTVSQLQSENLFRREKIQAECTNFAEKKKAQDEKISAREMKVAAAKNRLQSMEVEEKRLHSLLLSLENEIETGTKELEKRLALKNQINQASNEIRNFRNVLEEKDAALLMLEEKVESEAAKAKKRYNELEGKIKKCARLEDMYEQYVNKEKYEKLSAEEMQQQIFTVPPMAGCKKIRLSQLEDSAGATEGRRSSECAAGEFLGGESVLLVDE